MITQQTLNPLSTVTMPRPPKRRRSSDNDFVNGINIFHQREEFHQPEEVPHTRPPGPLIAKLQIRLEYLEKDNDMLNRQRRGLEENIKSLTRRLEHIERKDEISDGRFLILEHKSGISYRFKRSDMQTDDRYVCCAANCDFQSSWSTTLRSHWKEVPDVEHRLMASLLERKYCYPCAQWFRNTKAFHSHEAKHTNSSTSWLGDVNLQEILGHDRGLDAQDTRHRTLGVNVAQEFRRPFLQSRRCIDSVLWDNGVTDWHCFWACSTLL